MAPSPEPRRVQVWLPPIEQLITTLLQRQTNLGFMVASLELPDITGVPLELEIRDADPSPGCATWATVVKKGRNRLSFPLYDSQDDATDVELSNFFAPLAAFPTSPSPPLRPGDNGAGAAG